jgi:glycosyltransferase involved in cell wall biosynthesis
MIDAIGATVNESTRPTGLRILHVYKDVFPPVVGGIEMQIDALRNAMPDVVSDVLICSRSRHTERATTGTGAEIRVGELGPRLLSTPLAPAFPLWLRRLDSDLIHLHSPNPTGEVSTLLARRDRPLIVSYHADVVRQARFERAYRPVVGACLARASAIVTATRTLAETSPSLRPYADKVRVIPHGVDVECYDSGAVSADKVAAIRARYGGPLVISVGRLVYYKGHDRLIAAARGLDATVLIVGEGPERDRLEGLAREVPNVRLLGELDEPELVAHLAAADCFVLASTSRAESFGIAVAEAQAMGLPAVVTDTGAGTCEAIEDGVTGTLVPSGEHNALRRAIEAILDDTSRRREMGLAARERAVKRHALPDRAADVLALYREVLPLPTR